MLCQGCPLPDVRVCNSRPTHAILRGQPSVAFSGPMCGDHLQARGRVGSLHLEVLTGYWSGCLTPPYGVVEPIVDLVAPGEWHLLTCRCFRRAPTGRNRHDRRETITRILDCPWQAYSTYDCALISYASHILGLHFAHYMRSFDDAHSFNDRKVKNRSV